MGFAMGSSCFLQTPLSQHLCLTSSSQSFLLTSFRFKNTKNFKKQRSLVIASSSSSSNLHGITNESDFCKRRAIVVLGISALPFLQVKARADAETLVEERDLRALEENQSAEQLHQGEVQINPLLSLLNVVGVIGSGVLGALYTLAQKEKTTTETTIESLKNRLVEKDAAMVTLEKNFERKILNEQEERDRINNQAKEERHSMSNQLTTANGTIDGLRKELTNEKRLIEELKIHIAKLQNDLVKSGEDNKMLEEKLKEKLDSIEVLNDRINLLTLEIKDKEDNLQNLNSTLNEKESECDNLIFMNKRSKQDLTEASSEIKSLKGELFKTREDLNLKNSTIDDLKSRIILLTAERDDVNRELKTIQEDYKDLKSSSEKKAATDAEILRKMEHELHQFEEKLRLALNEASNNQRAIADLTKERDSLRTLLEVEVDNVKKLQHELWSKDETLQTSIKEVSDLSEQLRKSKRTCEELASAFSTVKNEFAENQEMLMSSLEEARSESEVLSAELVSVKNDFEKTKEESQILSNELARVTETRENLKKELLDVYKIAESASHDLKEERNMLATLQKQLEASEKQIQEDKKARKSLETDLEDATKSLDEVNKNVLMLSRELDTANSRVESLEVEKDVLYKSLTEQKNLSKEAKENIEEAHDIIMKLGKERENLDNRVKKLEEELASAKGEIIRLRSQKSSSKIRVNDVPKKKIAEVENDTAVTGKKVESDAAVTGKKVDSDAAVTGKKVDSDAAVTGKKVDSDAAVTGKEVEADVPVTEKKNSDYAVTMKRVGQRRKSSGRKSKASQ
ncbi:hypothetical protein AQUCO_00100557v1 [Aquilegia coerulea]|uniref:MAR-binding filament-like protein 1-1 n=1 Tax=Aquilegia coerulea TaxID=218851 RepID=A0A2G5FAX2_AQUCA|nr:hypothetical protein AQUCO_00100557v1 [Aquilegia coerulea]